MRYRAFRVFEQCPIISHQTQWTRQTAAGCNGLCAQMRRLTRRTISQLHPQKSQNSDPRRLENSNFTQITRVIKLTFVDPPRFAARASLRTRPGRRVRINFVTSFSFISIRHGLRPLLMIQKKYPGKCRGRWGVPHNFSETDPFLATNSHEIGSFCQRGAFRLISSRKVL